MSDDTLTLDALVEEVARALRRARLLRADAGPVWRAFNDEAPAEDADRAIARTALAAVAKAAGKGALEAGEHLTSTYADLCADESTEAHDAARVATLLRALLEGGR